MRIKRIAKKVLFLFVLGSVSKAIAFGCVIGQFSVVEGRLAMCRSSTSISGSSYELPTNKELISVVDQYGADPVFSKLVEKTAKVNVVQLRAALASSDQQLAISIDTPQDNESFEKMAVYLTDKAGLTGQVEDLRVTDAANKKLLDLKMKAERLRLGDKFNLTELGPIAEANKNLIKINSAQGCSGALKEASIGEPMRVLIVHFRDGKSQRMFLTGYAKKGDSITLSMFPLDGEKKLETRKIKLQPGGDPLWISPDGKSYPFDPNLEVISAEDATAIRDFNSGGKDGTCYLADRAASLVSDTNMSGGASPDIAQ